MRERGVFEVGLKLGEDRALEWGKNRNVTDVGVDEASVIGPEVGHLSSRNWET
jgi:hypothetical protein